MTATVPNEFVEFVRETGIRAFDRLAARINELPTPMRGVVRPWSRLSRSDQEALMTELIAAAQITGPAEPPEPAQAKQRQPIKRYEPEEVAPTLPQKAAKKKTAKKKPKTRVE